MQNDAPPFPDSVTIIDGKPFMEDAKGRLTPESLVKPVDKLEDQLVRTIMGHADALNQQIARFKGHTFDDIATFITLASEKYGASKRGGLKGNMTFTSYDGCLRVQVKVADRLTFGPQLQIAKGLIDECINDWAADAHPIIRKLVNHAFEPQKEGQVNTEALFSLRNIEIDDPRWISAVQAINDSIRIIGSKTYLNFHTRPSPEEAWEHIPINISSAVAPKAGE